MKKKILAGSILALITLLLLEGALRLQQAIGPLIDLRFEHVTAEGLSDIVNHKLVRQEIVNVESLTIFQCIELLKKQKIDLLICGGITNSILENIELKNIKTIPFICGEVSKILKAVLKGKDITKLFSMPGKHKRRENI